MTDKNACMNILNGMVERGYNLMGKTVEQIVDMMNSDVEFFENMAKRFDQWNKNH